MCCAAFLFSLMGIATKWASMPFPHAHQLPASEIAVVRYMAGVIFLGLLHQFTGADLLGKRRWGLLWRGISGGVASTAFFIGIQTTSLTHATLLNNTTIIWGSLFAAFMLGEKLRAPALGAIALALIGVVRITNPGAAEVQPGDLVSLFSGVMAGLAIVQVRKLRRTESSQAIFFYLNIVGLPIAIASFWLMHSHPIIPSPVQALALLFVGITAVSAQLLMTYGYKAIPAAQGSLITLTAILMTAIMSHWLFHECLGWNTLIGGLCVVAGAVTLSIWPPTAQIRSDSTNPR